MINDTVYTLLFELKSAFKKISTFVYFLLFFSISAFAAYVMGGGIKGGTVSFGFSERMFINSPITILNLATLFTALGGSIIAALFGQSICKDYLANLHQVIFSKPIHIKGFLLGRFLAALSVMTFIFLSIPLGIAFATILPGLQNNMVADVSLWAYIQPMVVSVIPNVFIFGSIYFVIASMTKKMGPIYIAGILVLMGWLLSQSLTADLDNKTLSALIDPFGLSGINDTIKYWSVTDKQNKMLWWTSYYLYNRLAWMSIGLSCFGHAIFRFKALSDHGDKKKKLEEITQTFTSLPIYSSQNIQSTDFKFNVFFAQTKIELKQATQNIYFITLAIAAILHLIIASTQMGQMFGTNTFPVTHKVLTVIASLLNLYMMVIITYWCGELVWRDRDNRFSQIVDSSPAPTFAIALSKLVSVNILAFFFIFLFMLVGLTVQTVSGYHHYEIGQYLFSLFVINGIGFFFLSCLAIFFQTVTNNKYVAHGLMILFYVTKLGLSIAGVTNKLFIPGAAPIAKYSDMNGYGHFLFGFFTFKIFWTLLGLILLSFSYLMWPRGSEQTIRITPMRLDKKWKIMTVSLVALFITVGSFIYYNTHILNEFLSPKENEQNQVTYETTYKSYESTPQLTTIAVFPRVDIFPHSQSLKADVVFTLKNKTDKEINQIFINIPTGKNIKSKINLNVPNVVVEDNRRIGVIISNFQQWIKPGEQIQLHYSVDITHPGFNNSADDTQIIDNGSFIHNNDFFPSIGYDSRLEIESPKTREKYSLPPKLRMPEITDTSNLGINYLNPTSHWIDFETVVSTSDDQIAIAPGYLIKEWRDQDRRYFHYKMDQKILNFYSFISGKYEVKRDVWESGNRKVNIEVYYHPTHTYNIDSMIDASKEGLSYFSKNFSPYQYTQYRIIEFPLYATYAQAFPNTIPFSENIGFIAKVNPKDPEDIDYPFYVTAHELAHQWWGHQVIGANVQGATMLSESLAQYSALMVMEKKFGIPSMKKFLKYELNGYLMGRGTENISELPLRLNENQGYIHYNKGSLSFYQAKNILGEDALNANLKKFINKFSFKGPPYPTSNDLLESIYGGIAPDQVKRVDELFSSIILYENKLHDPSVQGDEGHYKLSIQVKSKKIKSNELGYEEEVPFKDSQFTVGVKGKDGNYIYLEDHYFQSGHNLVILELSEQPIFVSIDPLNILVEKNTSDNEMRVD